MWRARLVDISYQIIWLTSNTFESGETYGEELDDYPFPIWAIDYLLSHDFIESDIPIVEVIMEVMLIFYHPREELHHQSSFLPRLDKFNE